MTLATILNQQGLAGVILAAAVAWVLFSTDLRNWVRMIFRLPAEPALPKLVRDLIQAFGKTQGTDSKDSH